MKLALLGCDSDLLALARSAIAQGHEIACLCDAGDALPALRALAPGAVAVDAWDALVADNTIEAVLVARASEPEARLEQLRRLAQAGVPLLVSHPFDLSMLAYYELDMIRRDVGGPILPCLPGRTHPAVARLSSLVGEGRPLGRIEQATFERSTPRRDRAGVLGQFARDADVLRALCGELTKVSSLAPVDEAARYANLGVQLSGPGGAVVRWSIDPAATVAGRLTLRGTLGKAVLHMSDGGVWRMDLDVDEHSTTEEFPGWDEHQAALDMLVRARDGEPVRPDWTDAARSIELTDAVERSLARGRTIELHDEEISEQATFKGLMTSVGCGLLVLGLVSLVIAAVAAKLGIPWAGYWLYVLLGVFGLFLLLQLFKLVFPPSTIVRPAGPDTNQDKLPARNP